MRIRIDEARCVGGGQCVLAAPALFDQRDEDGVAFLLIDGPVPGPLHEQAREAALLCPALAIELDER